MYKKMFKAFSENWKTWKTCLTFAQIKCDLKINFPQSNLQAIKRATRVAQEDSSYHPLVARPGHRRRRIGAFLERWLSEPTGTVVV